MPGVGRGLSHQQKRREDYLAAILFDTSLLHFSPIILDSISHHMVRSPHCVTIMAAKKPGKQRGKLTAKQARFVAEYLIDLNATGAARRAGYSTKTADRIGPELLGKPWVAEAIRKGQAERLDKAEAAAIDVIRELQRIAFTDLRQLYHPDGRLKHPHEMDDRTAAVIAQVEITEEFEGQGKDRKFVGLTKKVRFWDKLKALELLAKRLGLVTDKLQVAGDPAGPPVKVEHSGSTDFFTRLNDLAGAFADAAARNGGTGEGPVPDDGAGKPVDP